MSSRAARHLRAVPAANSAADAREFAARAREHLSGSVEAWRRALSWYVRGLKDHDFREVDSAFKCLRSAEIQQDKARQLLRELESASQPAATPPAPAAH